MDGAGDNDERGGEGEKLRAWWKANDGYSSAPLDPSHHPLELIFILSTL